MTVTGFVSLPACCRGSRTYQHFFVNGRPVKSKLLMAALERAYENQKMVGKFPGCVLQLQVKASQVDVNVHPAKTEVKFLHERQVFDGVYYGVLSALQGRRRHPTVTLPRPSRLRGPVPAENSVRSSSRRRASRSFGTPRGSAAAVGTGVHPRVPLAGGIYPRFFPKIRRGNPPIFAEMWINRWKMLKNPGRRRCSGPIHPTVHPPSPSRPPPPSWS